MSDEDLRDERGTFKVRRCITAYQNGLPGARNGTASFISGCTVTVACGLGYSGRCKLKAYSAISTDGATGHRVWLNSRLRIFRNNELLGRYDTSCTQLWRCATSELAQIRGGSVASVQCNGVRANQQEHYHPGGSTKAYVQCQIRITAEY